LELAQIRCTCSRSRRCLCVLLAETGPHPHRQPATHLELTMIHEAMPLSTRAVPGADWSGAPPSKLVLMTLLANVFSPTGSRTACGRPLGQSLLPIWRSWCLGGIVVVVETTNAAAPLPRPICLSAAFVWPRLALFSTFLFQ